ncbi:hypothetical protein HanIR_Chr07g0334011 [Helianthus annuus]|nr:hypothetical protein HanIR_Chr07g0334011 [Helianthus annuus]
MVKPIDDFDFTKMRKGSDIYVEAVGQGYKVVDQDMGFQYVYPEQGGDDEDMEEGNEEEEEEEEAKEEVGKRPRRQRFARRHNEASKNVAQFMVNRRMVAYGSYNLGQQDIYDNVFAVMVEAREREREKGEKERRLKAEEEWRTQQQEWWAM